MVKAVQKTAKIVRTMDELNGARVSELASRLNMPESTVHAHLQTLESAELVIQNGDEYRNSLEFTRIGRNERFNTVEYRLAYKFVRRLNEETGYRSAFITEQHGMGVFVHSFTNQDPTLNYERIGSRDYLNVLAGGKVILAEMDIERKDAILDKIGLHEKTPNSITDRDEFEKELDKVRKQGYALNDEESVKGMRAVSAVVSKTAGLPIGAFSIAGPANKLKGEIFSEEMPDSLLGLTNQYELELSHGDPDLTIDRAP